VIHDYQPYDHRKWKRLKTTVVGSFIVLYSNLRRFCLTDAPLNTVLSQSSLTHTRSIHVPRSPFRRSFERKKMLYKIEATKPPEEENISDDPCSCGYRSRTFGPSENCLATLNL
jgi:hypothetical protein